MDMKRKNIFLALLVALMSTAVCSAQEGESTKEGVPVVEEIVVDSDAEDSTNINKTQVYSSAKMGNTWSVTYTNDSIDAEAVEEVLEEVLNGGLGELIGGMAGATALCALLVVGLILLCIFGLPILGIILLIWLIIKVFKRDTPVTNASESATTTMNGQGRDRTIFNKGVKNICLGVGLAFFLGIMMGNVGVGIGVLIACIGIGELLVDYFSKR